MPRGTRRSRGSEKPTEQDEIDKELDKAEAEAEAQGQAGPNDVESEAEESSETATAVDERPEPAAPPPKQTRRRGGGAQIRVTATGPAEQVRESLANFGGNGADDDVAEPEEEPEPDEEVDENTETFIKLLSSPKYFVSVSREMPSTHNGINCSGKLRNVRYNCPTTFDAIRGEVFERFGGEAFNFYIHPRKTNGELTVVAAIQVRNPETDIPLNEGREIGAPIIEPTEELADPAMAVDDNDPLRKIEASIAEQARVATTYSKLKMSRKLMKEMNREDEDEPARELAQTADPEVAILRKQISDMAVEQRMEKRQSAFEDRIMTAIEAMGASKKGGSDNALLIAMMQSADQKFQTMMTTFIPLLAGQGKKTDDIDVQLARLAKIREAMGGGDGGGKLKGIEQKIMEKMMDRFFDGDDGGGGGATGDVADVAKVALKEFAPIAKTFVENRVGPPPANGPTKEEFSRAVVQEAQRISQTAAFREALANDLAAKGLVIKAQPSAPALPAPAAGAAPKAAGKVEKKVEEGDEEVVNGDEIEPPPSPMSEAYSRKLAVDFVLDTVLREMVTRKEDGFAVGDILDRLDEELLTGLLSVNNADGLNKLIGPHADPAKLAAITNAAKSDVLIEEWVSKVILSAKAAYRKSMEEAGASEREAAAKQGT